jgi:hypothetical protein
MSPPEGIVTPCNKGFFGIGFEGASLGSVSGENDVLLGSFRRHLSPFVLRGDVGGTEVHIMTLEAVWCPLATGADD